MKTNYLINIVGPTAIGKTSLAIQLAKDSKKNHSLRNDLKNAANKYLYKSLKTLKQFEQFLEEAHKTSQLGNKLKDGYIIN